MGELKSVKAQSAKYVFKGTLRDFLWKEQISLNEVANKNSDKLYKISSKEEEIKFIKKALLTINLNVGNVHTKDEIYNEDVQASVKLFQSLYKSPPEQLHPYNTPLSPDGEVGEQTLLALDEALINKVKFQDPQVVHFDGKYFSFIDNETGTYHVCDGSGLHISGEQLCYKEKPPRNPSLDAIDLSGYAVGATGTMQAGAQAYYETLTRQQKHALAEKMKQKVSRIGKPELIKTSTIKSVNGAVLSESISKKLGVLSVGIVVIDVIDDKEVRASHVLNASMVAVSFIPVVGWMIGGGYFVADIATLAITGNSIGGYLDDAVDKPLASWKDN